MIEVALTRGYVALVDDEDYPLVEAAGSWSARPTPRTVYAQRAARLPDGRATTMQLHRFLTGWPFVDHRNGNGLDNRRVNLRRANRNQNARNARVRADNSSGYKGVCWHRATNKWIAQIAVNGRRLHLGLFATAHAAGVAYDVAALHHFGDFAVLNFPLESA